MSKSMSFAAVVALSMISSANVGFAGGKSMVLEYAKKKLLYKVSAKFRVDDVGGDRYRISSDAGGKSPLGRFGMKLQSHSNKEDYSTIASTSCEQKPKKEKQVCYSVRVLGGGEFLYLQHDGVKKTLQEAMKLSKSTPGIKALKAAKMRKDFNPSKDVLYDGSSFVLAATKLGISPGNPKHTAFAMYKNEVLKISARYQETTSEGLYKINIKVVDGDQQMIPTHVLIDPDYEGSGESVITEIIGRKPVKYSLPLKRAKF